MVFLMETKIDVKRIEKIRRRCGFENGIDVGAAGSRGGISMAWKVEITVCLNNFSKSYIDVIVKEDNVNEEWRFTGFYGSPYATNKDVSWNLLRKLGDRDDDTIVKLIDTKIHFNMEIDKDDMYWEQRALESDDGREISDESAINESASNYFQNLFSSNGTGNLSHILKGIHSNISSDINTDLLVPFTAAKVFSALKEIGPTKAPGCDGFPALFFQRFWHIVGKDVEKFCLGILNDGRDFDSLNLTDIVLIPKLPNPTSFVNFRPISLCTVLYKIVAKVIANRLKKVIGKCIDKTQSNFLPRRLITNNVLIAYELLHTPRQRRNEKKRLMAVKLDMSKAYDRVEWVFLKEVMLQIGFAREWVTLIMKCISTVSYTVNINGRRGKVFKPTRELHQGRRKKEAFQNLKDKIKLRIVSWSTRLLSQGGKKHRKLVSNTSCPLCGERAETIDHIFRECPVIVDV
ncbi:hypothetical protein PVK06_026837 [Gossypium arboreum]|uniref:Reverse transcriptase n=1 Tax=Gossypium arboreum TaxID=29729 RepID=A0ABR0NYT0_GOSAR|nr:hypothetical protein PVK06_026837 [Gossypium arboreum]